MEEYKTYAGVELIFIMHSFFSSMKLSKSHIAINIIFGKLYFQDPPGEGVISWASGDGYNVHKSLCQVCRWPVL